MSVIMYGPTGQYPVLAEMVNSKKMSLVNCWFFFMDENCGQDGRVLGREHPLSFKGEAEKLFLSRLHGSCGLQPERVVFPNEDNIAALAARIEEVGGIDTCYGGIGIHSHLAFNKPGSGVRDTSPRLVTLNDFTVTINAV